MKINIEQQIRASFLQSTVVQLNIVINTYFASLSRAIFSTSPTEYALQ